jgi:Txe/YoeB family toxin of Txe-Axe toxin-antitoxin module
MPKFIEQITIGIATFIVSVFLPKHFVTLIREIIKFTFISFIKYWYATLSIIALIFWINYYTDCIYLDQFYSKTFIISIGISELLIVPTISLLIILFQKYKPINIAFYGSYSVKENEYLTIDIDSENLNERIEKLTLKISSSFYSFKNNFIKTNIINLPKFIPIILGARGLNKFILKRIQSNKHLASIHFIRDINKQSLSVVINFDKKTLIHSSSSDNFDLLIQSLSLDTNIHNSKIVDITIKIYMLFFGQSMMDILIDFKQFSEVHYILDDMENQLKQIENDVIDIPEKHKNSVKRFIDFWKGYVERYRGIVFAEQGETTAAVQHIIKSLDLSPYYPYEDYETLKQDYTKKYAINLTPKMNEILDEIKDMEFDEINLDKNYVEENEKVTNNLEQQVDYKFATFNHEFLREIILRDESEKTINALLNGFAKLDKSNPFILLSIAEVIRFVKKGNEKVNAIYVNRFDETINLLKEVLKLDNEFPLIHTKIGSLMAMKGMHFNNEQMVEEGMKEWEKGMHYMTQLGFNTKPNPSS